MKHIDYKDVNDRKRFYKTSEWRRLRKQRLIIDNYECQWCKEKGRVVTNKDTRLIVHHIEEVKDRPELALDIDNLVTVCFECHEEHHDRNIYKKKETKWSNDEWW
ncbi:HNH endonuclease [Staphylococcus agnetis]|uniref:Putative HNH nuclease YajD n=1 Tax=Staphylococcus agnetis TaxID=985762 RepID=A0ABD7TSJ6_9STAP|nr:HNH endonuclease signature motif containing protein [Staphylococcus agnetis]UXU54259.1 HNH endonuclease [Staphylococcus agnetis]UXU56512.1 HNH endonuclease [Staphylococcus agnetis]UXU58832.1 HNH endonuclease [Staphylococcus agnetis]UXU61157.1 HNH endonuclease [Staphylococcus agnetis]